MGSKWAFGYFYPTIKVTRRRQNRLAQNVSSFNEMNSTTPNLLLWESKRKKVKKHLDILQNRCYTVDTIQGALVQTG